MSSPRVVLELSLAEARAMRWALGNSTTRDVLRELFDHWAEIAACLRAENRLVESIERAAGGAS